MNVHEIKEKIEKEGSVQIPRDYAMLLMQQAEIHGVNAEWEFNIRGAVCTVSRPMRQGEEHPLHSR